MRPPPTKKQAEILRAIREFIAAHGYAPSFTELGKELGIGRVTAHKHTVLLERKGYLRREEKAHRGITLYP